jgi:hypothetical protein
LVVDCCLCSLLFAQEVLGAIWSDRASVFDPVWLTNLEERKARLPHTAPSDLFALTMIDPAGGGGSETAIVTVIRDANGYILIAGAAAQRPVTEVDMKRMVTSYFMNFVRLPTIGAMQHVVCVESNYGGAIIADMFVQAAKEG